MEKEKSPNDLLGTGVEESLRSATEGLEVSNGGLQDPRQNQVNLGTTLLATSQAQK